MLVEEIRGQGSVGEPNTLQEPGVNQRLVDLRGHMQALVRMVFGDVAGSDQPSTAKEDDDAGT